MRLQQLKRGSYHLLVPICCHHSFGSSLSLPTDKVRPPSPSWGLSQSLSPCRWFCSSRASISCIWAHSGLMIRGKRHHALVGGGCWSSNPLPAFSDTPLYWHRTPSRTSPLRCRLLFTPELLFMTAHLVLKEHFSFLRFAVLPVPAVQSTRQSVRPGWAVFSWPVQPWGALKFGVWAHGSRSGQRKSGNHGPKGRGSLQREGSALGQQMNSSSESKLVLFGVDVV